MNCCDLLYFAKLTRIDEKQSIFRSNAHCEIFYVKSGNCNLHYNGGKFKLNISDIVLIPADVKYRFEFEDECSFIIIGFDKSCCDFENQPYLFNGYDNAYSAKLIEMIEDEFFGYKLQRKAMLNLLLSVIIISVFRNVKACDSKKNIENDNFNYIINLMDSHSNNGLDINEISDISGLSYHRFRHKFKEFSGVSPQQYIIKQRLNFAKRLLESTDYSTTLIAKACDFHSVPQFITCFSKQEGLTPIKYRKAVRETKKPILVRKKAV